MSNWSNWPGWMGPTYRASTMKRIMPILPPPLTRFIVPNIDTVHNRVPIEIMRGCTRGCRFCHAGMVTRPVRERSVEEVVKAVVEAIAQTGYEEVALLSLSSSDYTNVVELVSAVARMISSRFTPATATTAYRPSASAWA